MNPTSGSVHRLIGGLKEGDQDSAQRLWEEYFHRLVPLARSMLCGAYRRAADEEDVALSAFASFCRGVEAGRFPQIYDRDNLWRVLLTLIARKSAHFRRDQHRQKRDADRVLDEAGLQGLSDAEFHLDALAGNEPTPEFAAIVAEECERQLNRLDNDELKQIAVLKMEGYTNAEIADRLDCALRTIDRRLELIRNIWIANSDS